MGAGARAAGRHTHGPHFLLDGGSSRAPLAGMSPELILGGRFSYRMVRLVPTTTLDAHKIGRACARSELFAAFYFPAAVQFLRCFRVFLRVFFLSTRKYQNHVDDKVLLREELPVPGTLPP